MRRWALAVLLGTAACAEAPPAAGTAAGPLGVSELVRGAVRTYPQGGPYSFELHRGNVVLLDVWASYCPACTDVMRRDAALQAELGPRGLDVIELNVDEDERQAQATLQHLGVSPTVLRDLHATFAERTLRIRRLPTAFVLDRRGGIRYVHEEFPGAFAAYPAELEELLRER